MTEQEARHHLEELWETGEIPNNFTEDHTEFDKAVRYTMKNGYFDYDKFYEEISIIRFGIWQVEPDALVAKDGHDYIIASGRFWEVREFSGHLVWDWLIHLTEKGWINKENVHDLNSAFFFCQDYFKDEKPDNLPYVSTAQTLFIQQQLLEIKDIMTKFERAREGRASAAMDKYHELTNNIKFL